MTTPHDRPTAYELLESIREWLEKDVATSVEGRLAFHTRVAINSLDIVMRELDLGGPMQQRHAEVLHNLGVQTDAELAEKIRSGQFDDRMLSVVESLSPVIADKVTVANPKYLRP